MKKIAVILILGLSLYFAMSFTLLYAGEDSDEQVSTVSLTIEPSSKLGIVDSAVSATLVKDSSSETAFDTGYVELDPNKPTLTVDSNKNWKLTARSSGFTGPYSKDIGDLYLKDAGASHVKNGFSGYKTLSGIDQEIASHTEGVKSETHPLQYKVLLDWEKDIPGTYEATITYTLSTIAS